MDTEQYSKEQLKELRKISLEHTWKWFEFQANQRMILFRFFLLVISITVVSIVTLITKNYLRSAGFISFTGAFFSILFLFIDRRIKYLLNVGYDALKDDEEYIANITGNKNIILKDTATNQYLTISRIFTVLFLFCTILFIVVGIICIKGN